MMFPVVFIHKNIGLHTDIDYLGYVLKQAKLYNQHVVLISDNTEKYDFVQNYHIDEFTNNEQHNTLESYYIHLSSNPHGFEFISIERWFILKEYLNKYGIDKAVYSDSDNLFYCDLEDECKNFVDYDLTLCDGHSGHLFFINNVIILDKFCDFINEHYINTDKRNKLIDLYKAFNGNDGGICDMTFLSWFKDEYKWIELHKDNGGMIFDNNINMTDKFQEDGVLKCKKIEMVNGKPYGTTTDDKKIEFKNLQFQGGFIKKYIKNYITYV